MSIVYRKFQPTEYVRVIKNGQCVKEGLGLSLFYNSLSTNVLAVPAVAFDGSFAFDELVTADYQTVCVQGAVTYVIEDFEKAVKMADFTYTGNYAQNRTEALNLFSRRINNAIKSAVIKETGKREIRSLLKIADEMAVLIAENLCDDDTITALGVRILAVNILGITARPETRRALEAAAREQILQNQDDAVYKRRNAAIEQERLIRENELNTEIRVAEKEKEKKEKEQEIRKKILQAELDMEMEKKEKEQEIREKVLESELKLEEREKEQRVRILQTELEEKIKLEERNRDFVDLEVENNKKRAEEKAFAAAAMMKACENANVALVEACALANMDPKSLMAKAFLELGENAGKIGMLNMTPDLLETIVGRSE